jgi:hypothetical protein
MSLVAAKVERSKRRVWGKLALTQVSKMSNGNYLKPLELNEDNDDEHIGALMMNGVFELMLSKGEPRRLAGSRSGRVNFARRNLE